MNISNPKIGLVINYSFLWSDEAKKGRIEGIKDRPCIIIGMKDVGADKTVLVAPITHRPPEQQGNIEVPSSVKDRLGLDGQRSWVVTSELNRFSWYRSPDLRPISRDQPDKFVFGMAPENLVREVRDEVRNHTVKRTISLTGRDGGETDR